MIDKLMPFKTTKERTNDARNIKSILMHYIGNHSPLYDIRQGPLWRTTGYDRRALNRGLMAMSDSS